MSSGGKGGGAQQSKNIYGTIAATFCWGPLDWLRAVIANGNYWFKADAGLTLTDDVTDLTGSLIDPSMVAPGGWLKLYRGTETQPADPALAGHPPYRGSPVLVGHRVFFGQESGVPPNLQIIAGRCPRVPAAIVAAADNIVDDRQVNPVAALAEFLLDERGAGKPQSLLDAPSWLASAHWCAQDQAHRDYTFISPLLVQPTALRDVVKQLIEPFGGFLRWTSEGKLACCIYEWGLDPGGLPVIDGTAWTAVPEFTDGAWEDIPTEVVVAYTDRDYQFQDNSVPRPNAIARKIRQLDDSRPLERKHTMRRAQAARQGSEHNRRVGVAPGSGKVQIRAPLFPTLLPGDKIKVDVDPEPGGIGSAQLCRIEKITQDSGDEATLELMTDGLLPAESYTPNWPNAAVAPDASCAPIAHALAIALPLGAFGAPCAVAFLATRPTADIAGFHVLFGISAEDDFAELGSQPGFAVRATLAADISAAALAANFTQTDGLDAPDATLAAATPGGNTTAAEDDVLLAVLATVDSQGRVALSDGVPVLEFVSIVARAAVAGATFTYTLLRGRLGTAARAWSAATTAVWILPRVNLVEWRHALIAPDYVDPKLLYFRLVAFTDYATDDSDPLPAADLYLPALAAQAPVIAIAALPAGLTVGVAYSVSGTITDANGDLASYRVNAALLTGPGGAVDFEITLQSGVVAPADKTLCVFRSKLVFPMAGTWRVIVRAEDATGAFATAQTGELTVALGSGGYGPDDGIVPDPTSNETVSSGIEMLILRWTNPGNTPLLQVEIFESESEAKPALPSLVALAPQDFYFRTGLPEGTTRYYWLQVVGKNNRKSAVRGPFTGTVVRWPVVNDIESTLDTEISARAAADATLTAAIAAEVQALNSAIDEQEADFTALVEQKKEEAITAAAGDATAKVGTEATARANETAALGNRATALESTVNNPTTGLPATKARVDTIESSYASTTYADAKKAEAIGAAAADATSKVSTEATARASADATLGGRATALESTVNNPTTGLPATKARVDTIESSYASTTYADAKKAEAISAAAADATSKVSTEATARASADGSLGAEYVLLVVTDAGGNRRVAGFRVTNHGGAGGSTDFVLQADKVAIVNSSGTNQKAPFAVVDGVVYLDMALIKSASITDAMIASLVADKITAGTLGAMILTAAKTATDSVFFNTGDQSRTMSATGAAVNTLYPNQGYLGTGGQIIWFFYFYGWATSSTGLVQNRFGKSSMTFRCACNGGGNPAAGDQLAIEIVYRINGGSVVQANAFQFRATPGNGSFAVNGAAVIDGLVGTDSIQFGVRAKSVANNNATTIDAVQLAVDCGNV